MWAIFVIPIALLAIVGGLLLGWGIPFIALFGVLLVGAAVLFIFQRAAVEPTADSESSGDRPSWMTRHWWE
jgi:uncharacterized membrane protein YdjX (TVP38/TMEM64 family)